MGKSQYDLDYAGHLERCPDEPLVVPIDVGITQLKLRGQAVFATAKERMTEFARSQSVAIPRFELRGNASTGKCEIVARLAKAPAKAKAKAKAE